MVSLEIGVKGRREEVNLAWSHHDPALKMGSSFYTQVPRTESGSGVPLLAME